MPHHGLLRAKGEGKRLPAAPVHPAANNANRKWWSEQGHGIEASTGTGRSAGVHPAAGAQSGASLGIRAECGPRPARFHPSSHGGLQAGQQNTNWTLRTGRWPGLLSDSEFLSRLFLFRPTCSGPFVPAASPSPPQPPVGPRGTPGQLSQPWRPDCDISTAIEARVVFWFINRQRSRTRSRTERSHHPQRRETWNH
jgi:hypothetical protein